MVESKSAGHAKSYFSDALSKSDYYVSDQELAGRWEGRLAERLGLDGTASKEAFFALCENRHPLTGQPLTPRTKENRRVGYDINFHCPKSVSVLHVLAKDDHILKAFEESVSETMKVIEADSKTRVRKDGANNNRNTGELAWAHFVHQTARPVEDRAPDPHLHSHCFTFNATWDEAEQKIKAGEFGDIKRDMPFYQAQFHKALSDKLMTLGYQVRKTDKSFEVEGVPQRVIDLFSKRTDEIGRIAKEKGITDAKELGELGARTRSIKQKGISMDDLKKEWRDQINGLNTGKADEGTKIVRFAKTKEAMELKPEQCVDHALLHCFERSSVMADRRILETAIHYSVGYAGASATNIIEAFRNDNRIIHVNEKARTLCTTKEVLHEEKRMVDLARQGQGKVIPLYKEAPALNVTGQQAAAIEYVLTTSNRVSIIRGSAGAGKTTLMREAVVNFNAAGKEVTVIAPTAEASRGVLKSEGFEDANTVARFLTDEKMQEKIKGQVLWVDEAGLLGTKDTLALLDIVSKNNARLILGGDTRQHASVVRGDALRILNTVAGICTAEVSKIYRQQNEQYRSAVENLSKGNVHDAFQKLDAIGLIKSIDPMNPNKQLVTDYIEAVKKGKTTLVISPTHKQGEEVTKEIREEMREEGLIGKKEFNVHKLTNLNLTEAQKKDHRNFHEGDLVQFNQNAKGFMRGSSWVIDGADKNEIRVENEKGDVQILPTTQSNRYDVFRQDEIALSKGDKIRITKNGFDINNERLDNGQGLEVVSINKTGHITLRKPDGKTCTLDRSFGHIAHAHCITSYASQGKTVKEVFVMQPAATFPATDAKQFYVSVSRGRERVRIYTDDKEALLHHASKLGERQSALELVGNNEKHKEFVQQKQREEHLKNLAKKPAVAKTKQRDLEHEI